MLYEFFERNFVLLFFFYGGSLQLLVSLHKFVLRQSRRDQYLLFCSFVLLDIILYFFGTKVQHDYIAILTKGDFLLGFLEYYVWYLALIGFMMLIWNRYI